MSANADQIEFWNGPGGQQWVAQQETMDRTLGRIHAAIASFAAAQPGEAVVDIGCGTGQTTLGLADAVGETGRVIGVDISRPMLGLARKRAVESGRTIEFFEADASRHVFPSDNDLVFSRFGVMFFDDPVGAFSNIRKALKSGGRLAFVCWRAPQENIWASAPISAARPFLPPQPPADPLAPGPFAFADPERVKSILGGAGFRDVRVEPLDTVMNLGEALDAAAEQMMQVGPLSRLLADIDAATRGKIVLAVQGALQPYTSEKGVRPPAACWLVGARA
jgi:SAM-dependent methyltransferase